MRNAHENKTIEIHLIRHGKTKANEQKLYCGATDLPLSENGISELMDLKMQGIYPPNADLYFTSGLIRTEQTLNLLYGSVHRATLPQFTEYHFGEFEMKSYELLKEQSNYQAWITDESVPCPGGDSKQDFNKRILKGFELLTENLKHEKILFAVCHGGVISCIMEYLFPNTRNFYEWQPKPGRGYTLVYSSNKLQFYKSI